MTPLMDNHVLDKDEAYSPYIKLLCELKNFMASIERNIETVLLYGSLARHEIAPPHSDIDILVVIKNDVIPSDLAQLISANLVKLQSNYGIKIHFRLRNKCDIWEQTSGLQDSGITSIINKARDGRLILGKSLDDLYIKKIVAVSDGEIKRNLLYRFSELKYQLRSSISSIDRLTSKELFIYKFGSLISQFAELTCYSHGRHFINRKDAIGQAAELLNELWVWDALPMKKSKIDINVFQYVPLIERGILRCIKAIDSNDLACLRKFKISNVHDMPVINNANEESLNKICLNVKMPEITVDGTLSINLYKS